MAPKFYLAKEGAGLKPVSPLQLRQMIMDGLVLGDDLVFAKHIKVWTKVREVKGYRSQIAKLEALNSSPEAQAAKVLDTPEFQSSEPSKVRFLPAIHENGHETSVYSPPRRPSLLSMVPETDFQKPRRAFWEWSEYSGNDRRILFVFLSLIVAVVIFINWPASGPSKYQVTGTVKFNGKPVELGRIQFDSPDGSSASSAGPIKDGIYELAGDSGVGKGPMTVRIWGFRKTGKKLDPKKMGPGMENYKGDLEEREPFIPAKHNSSSTELVEISASKPNVFDFELEGEPLGKPQGRK